MELEELIKEVMKEVKKSRDRAVGSNTFQQASSDYKKTVERLVNEHSIFPYGALIKLLNMYRIDGNKLFYRKKVKNGMDYVNENNKKFRITTIRMGSVKRIFLGEEEVWYMLKHFYEKGLIIDYKKKNVLKDLKEAAVQL